MGGPIFSRKLLAQERDELDALLGHPADAVTKRATIILLSSEERYRASEISDLVGMHASSVRYWIHRFNEEGLSALRHSEALGRGSRMGDDVRVALAQLATTPPRLMGLKFTVWTLRKLREYLIEQKIVLDISHETIRRILKESGIDWRSSGSLPQGPGILDLLDISKSTES